MRKNVLFSIIVFLILIASALFIRDGLTYSISLLMALVIISVIRRNSPWVTKMTKWAKANPRKTQLLIMVLQLVLMTLGLIGGYNFKQLGYEFSPGTAFVFGTIMITGFLSVNFLPKRRIIVIPAEVNKNRLLFMSIALSSFILMVITGNNIISRYPNSLLSGAITTIDKAIFHNNNTKYAEINDAPWQQFTEENYMQSVPINSSSLAMYASYAAYENETIKLPKDSNKEIREKVKTKKNATRLEKKKAKLIKLIKNKRLMLAAGITAGAVLLIILLVIATCTGVCLVIGGISALISGEFLGILAILGGGLITWLSIKGISKVSKKDKKKKEIKP
ncbi:MAG TPA: hypothetical protein VM888_11550 [Chitinophagaceae bacterium]|nr:hypothetical protein [Chitinophagaceae bacterium]